MGYKGSARSAISAKNSACCTSELFANENAESGLHAIGRTLKDGIKNRLSFRLLHHIRSLAPVGNCTNRNAKFLSEVFDRHSEGSA